MRPLIRPLIYLVLLAFTFSVKAGDLSQDEALRLREAGRILPLENVLAIIAARHPGSRLLEVELEEEDDIYIYEVELITRESAVRELEIEAASGDVLKDEEED
jgi:uncharacterized membrane protein YkoI